MAQTLSRPADSYNPLYFLASLGAGGLSVTFFMYLMFWIPHPGQPVPVFEDIARALTSGNVAMQTSVIIALAGIAVFAVMNLTSLVWNLRALSAFKRTQAYETLTKTNAQSSLLAAPLAVAMSINGMFIVGLVFVPGLWSVVEYLFPLAMVAFLALGIWALRLIGDYLGRILSQHGAFDLKAHNSFAQMLPAFALSMIGVGLSAPAAMSTNQTVVGVALILSGFFAVAALLYAAFAGLTAMSAMLQHGTAKEAAPTLLILVPLMTVLGILFLRQNHGLHTQFDSHVTAGETMMMLGRMLAVQIAFLLLGLTVLKRLGYFRDFVFGRKTSPGSYALVCPGVALSVMLHFFVNKGLVGAGVIDKFSTPYWALTALALLSQILMIALVLRLNRQHFRPVPQGSALPAE